jgi:hypothetical protein
MRATTFLISLLILTSCDNPIRFEVPQPEGRPNEKSIPKKLIGQYSSLNDSSVLTINTGLILKRKVTDLATPKSQLDSAERATFKHDTVYTVAVMGAEMTFIVKGDSVFEHVDYKDTIFLDSRGDVLKKI